VSFLFHKTLCFNLLQLATMSYCCSGQHSCISCRRSGFNSPFEPTNFQLSFFSFSSFWGHQTFLFKTSHLRNHPSFRCSDGRVISHIKGLPLKLTYYYRALGPILKFSGNSGTNLLARQSYLQPTSLQAFTDKGRKMSSDQPDIKFEDADRYEKFMGVWSRMLGSKFIDWMSPDQGKKILVEE
jgi:hypothetical protein